METDEQIRFGIDARTRPTEYLSAHTAFSREGGNEVSGGSYVRKSLRWDGATNRTADNTDTVTVSIPAGTTVRWMGRWTAETGGSFLGMVPNGSTKAKIALGITSGAGAGTGHSFFSIRHGFDQHQKVVFTRLGSGVADGLTEGTVYYVEPEDSASATPRDRFSVRTSPNTSVAALTITGSSDMIVSNIVEETFSSAGELILAAGAYDLIGLG